MNALIILITIVLIFGPLFWLFRLNSKFPVTVYIGVNVVCIALFFHAASLPGPESLGAAGIALILGAIDFIVLLIAVTSSIVKK